MRGWVTDRCMGGKRQRQTLANQGRNARTLAVALGAMRASAPKAGAPRITSPRYGNAVARLDMPLQALPGRAALVCVAVTCEGQAERAAAKPRRRQPSTAREGSKGRAASPQGMSE